MNASAQYALLIPSKKKKRVWPVAAGKTCFG
jgi:hypothetical protein